MVSDDERLHRRVLDHVAQLLPTLPLDATPVDIGRAVHRAVKEISGCLDPYREVKQRSNDQALALYPRLQAHVEGSSDRLLAALHIAATGNVIDFGPDSAFDLERSIEEGLAEGLTGTDYPLLQERLGKADRVLYLGDNAGEIVFDKVLIKELVRLEKKVTFVVRGEPILNDVTLKDASYVSLDGLAEVISSGSDAPGTTLSNCSPQFLDTFRHARLILSKGQGNFEGLSEARVPLFFLFKVKCPVVAREIDVKPGAIVLKAAEGLKVGIE